jgi:hypothetical protein
MPKAGKIITPKKRCCRDKPRCKRCPVVCKRLTRHGVAERLDDGRFVLSVSLSKKRFKAARA